MSPITQPDEQALAPLVAEVRRYWPGGEHSADHLADDPFHLTVVTCIDQPSWLAQLVLDTFPHLEASVQQWGSEQRQSRMYVLPAFPHRLLEWYEDEYKLNPDHDAGIRLDTFPTDAELGTFAPMLACCDAEDNAAIKEATATIATRFGHQAVYDYIATLDDHVVRDVDRLAEALQAYVSAMPA